MDAQAMNDRIAELEEEVTQLREMMFASALAPQLQVKFGLTRKLSELLALLVQHDVASHRLIDAALWFDRPEVDTRGTLQVMMAKLRRKLPDWGRPQAVWGVGYRLLPAARERLRAELDADAPAREAA